jgi:predicted DNA-binding helix-hairpin-helix protein
LDYESLKKFGVVLKRARHFITCKGKYFGESHISEDKIRPHLISENAALNQQNKQGEQISFYSLYPDIFQPQDLHSIITGEL